MAAASLGEELSVLYTEEEKSQIPENVGQKIQELWDVKIKEITALKIENEKLRMTGDQEKFQLERELLGIRSQLEEESRLKEEAKTRSEANDTRLNTLEEELQESRTKVNSLSREVTYSHNEQENASTQSAAMAGSLESRNKWNQELQDQVQRLEDQLINTTRAKCEAVIKAEEASSSEMHLQYKERWLEQERSLLSRQVERLQHQLEQRVEESLSQRRDHSNTILQLQSDLKHKLEELRIEKEENEKMHQNLDDKGRRIEELLSTLNESREAKMKLEETFRQELAAQKKLADIYQSSCKDEKEQCGELEKAVEELRKLLQGASEQYGCLERAKKKAEEDANEGLQQSNLLVKELKEELDRVNLLLEASVKKDQGGIEDLSPTASAASQLVSRGLSLSQLYSEYMNVSEKLVTTEEENKRLKRYVDQILQEIEERVPVFKKQREDHQRSLETIANLHGQLEDTLDDLQKHKLEAEEATRRAKYLDRENGRLGQEVKDLGKQVSVLVVQVEAARTGQPPPAIPMEEEEPKKAGEVISQRLVAFRDVAELQEQNNDLRASLRDLSQQMEAVEKDAVENRTQELKDELTTAKAQLAEMESGRERQESLMENIVNQRNMYRTLLQQQGPMAGAGMKQPSPQDPSASKAEVDKLKEELENAKKGLGQVRKEHEEYREEKNKNEKLLQNEYENLRTNMEKTRNENIKLISQAEYNDERIKTQQSNAEVLQRQIMAMEKNNATMQGIIGRHEATIETLRNELMSLQKKHSCAEVTVENLREERLLLKEHEARLMSERESSERWRTSQSMVLANLETIKINLERTDSETKMRHENHIRDLTEQCSRLKAKLESNIEVKEATMKLTDAQSRIKTMQQDQVSTNKTLVDVKTELSSTKTQLAEAQEKLRHAPSAQGPASTSPFRVGGNTPHMRDLQVQLTEERAKSTTLQASLNQSKKRVEDLMEVIKTHEKQLAETNDACKKAQEQLTKLQKVKSEVEGKLAKIESSMKEVQEEGDSVKTLLETQLAKMQDELQVTQKKLTDSTEALASAKAVEEKARKEAKEKGQLAGDVQDKYEREVMLHGADLQALAALKEKQAEYNTELQQVTMAKLKAEEAVRDTRLGFEERENVLRRESKELKMRSHELEEQNKALLEQFTQLSDKMAAIQTKMTVPGGENNASFSEDDTRSSDQLREVIKYLRRERDVAAAKCDVALTESERLSAQKKVVENQLEQARKSLSEEREKSQASLDSAGRYGELLRKVHTMDALADSNRLLREEKEGLVASQTEYKAKFEALEKQIEPMQEKQRMSDNKLEAITLEKKSLANEKDLYKKRTNELVEKLNRAKPEDFIKLQQDVQDQQKTIQSKEGEVIRLKNQLAQLSKNQQMIVQQKNQFQQQMTNARAELHKTALELKNMSTEKNRIQMQTGEEMKKLSLEKARIGSQLVASQERVRTMEATAQLTQQEMNRIQEQRNREQQQDKQQATELKQQIDALQNQLEATKKECEAMSEKVANEEAKAQEAIKKADNFEKQALQLRKIATKYKKAAEGGAAGGGEGEEPTAEKVKELEESVTKLKQLQEKAQEESTKHLHEVTTLKQNLGSKENEFNMLKTQSQQKEAELMKLRSDLENKNKELQMTAQQRQNSAKQLTELTKRLEESENKKQILENKISQLEKEVEMLNKKLQMQQRQMENYQKQAAGTSKPSTSGASTDKTNFEPPPTANIKPTPVAPSASPRSQTATQVVPPSRAIPTASIRPMAPPSGGSAPPQGSTVVVVSPLETHSDGMVSSTVTLPQATVTPTPAISAPTLLTTATTTPAATTMTSTLTATVSPTPALASLTTPLAQASALPSTPSTQAVQASAAQSSSASQSSLVSQSSVNLEAAAASQSTSSGGQSTQASKTLQNAAAASTTAQSTLASQSSSGQAASAGTSIVAPIVSAVPTAPAQVARQESQEVSADALVSQAIALVSPLSSQEVSGQSVASGKRKLDTWEATTKEPKRACMEDEEAGPSSSGGGEDNDEDVMHTPEEDVVTVDSEGEDGDYVDQDDEEEKDEDEDEDEQIDDEEQVDEDDDDDIEVIDDSGDEDMDQDEDTQGFNERDGEENREADEDMRDAEAEAEVTSDSSRVAESNNEADAPSESQRPQPSRSIQPSSSRGEGPHSGPGSSITPRAGPARQERPGPVGRQTLAPFSQLPQYEEAGDDSIVPSTPTLFVPRRGDGFSEAVSSPQVPSGGFVFGGNAEVPNPPQTSGLAQMAEGGLIDDTRIDLGLDDANRSQPTTPLRRSPTAELGAEAGVSTSEGESTREPPAITVTGTEQSNEETSRDSQDNYTEADSMAVEVGDNEEEEAEEDVDEEEDQDDDVIALEGEEDGEEGPGGEAGEAEERVGASGENDPATQEASSSPSQGLLATPRRITPITWDNSPQRTRPDRGHGFLGSHHSRGHHMRGARGGFPPSMRGQVPPLMRGQNPLARGQPQGRGPQMARRSRRPGFPPRGM